MHIHTSAKIPLVKSVLVFFPLAYDPVPFLEWEFRYLRNKAKKNKQLAACTTPPTDSSCAEILLGGVSRLSSPEFSLLLFLFPLFCFNHLFPALSHTSPLGSHSSCFWSFVDSLFNLLRLHWQVLPVVQQSAHIPSLHYLVSSSRQAAAYRWEKRLHDWEEKGREVLKSCRL